MTYSGVYSGAINPVSADVLLTLSPPQWGRRLFMVFVFVGYNCGNWLVKLCFVSAVEITWMVARGK